MTAAACAAPRVSRASVRRRRARLTAPPAIRRPRPKLGPRAGGPQQQIVLNLLHAPRFADQAPARNLRPACSMRASTTARSAPCAASSARTAKSANAAKQLRHHPVYRKPELLAERPNEVWSWDIPPS